ncbi:MAG TPA: glycosyltransferase family 2 protein [Bacteroidales bacterium]|nr:glycosyltransferase family 2 protein [Bacteroidales bacterium]HPR57315.1 glycosyltransferase family 2 protein [Bacteroidales bacterium]HRW97333.1 glycosyltransferase family 2 protein [Bacteroidales bacterium]
MNKPPHISIISPVYGASTLIDELVSRIGESVGKITDDYEIILVEDHGPDDSWEKIKAICRNNNRVIGIRHSRNFGQQYALNCGLDHARGEWVVTLDCDLQDRPEEIVNLYKKAQEGYDIVLASRQNRQDDFMKKLFSRLFYRVLSYLTDTHQDASLANFSLYHRKVVDALKSMNDYSRYYPTMIHWVGFRMAKINIEHAGREDGKKSSYNLKKRLALAFDTIVSFSNKPLRLTVKLGIVILLTSFMLAIVLVIRYFMTDQSVSGWTSTFLSLWFLSGIIITLLGMVGIYVGKIFETVKRRPSYIVGERINYQVEEK